MLAVQVDYWKLQESKRHNLVEEALGREQNQQGWITAYAARDTASANLQNAETNRGNLAVNRQNAESNRITALANQRNAESNARNAATNERNAEINAYNAETNRKNAESNALQAQASWKNANTQASLATYQTSGLGADVDRARKDLLYAQKQESIASKELTKAKTETENQNRDAQFASSIGKSPLTLGTYITKQLANNSDKPETTLFESITYKPTTDEVVDLVRQGKDLKRGNEAQGGRSR